MKIIRSRPKHDEYRLFPFVFLLLLSIFTHACSNDGITIGVEDLMGLTSKYAIADVRNIAKFNNFVLARTPSSLQLLDFTDVAAIKVKASLPLASDAWQALDEHTFALVKAGGKLTLVSISPEGVLSKLYQSSSSYAPGYIDLASDGDRLVVANENAGIYLYDLSDKSAPLETGPFAIPGVSNASSLALSGDQLIVASVEASKPADTAALSVVQLAENADPTVLGKFFVSYAANASRRAEGCFALQMSFTKDGLLITQKGSLAYYSLADPANPSLVRGIPLKGDPTALMVSDYATFGFSDDMEGEVAVNSPSVKEHVLLTTKGHSYDATMSGDKFLIADGTNGLLIVDFKKLSDLFSGIGGSVGGGGGSTGKNGGGGVPSLPGLPGMP